MLVRACDDHYGCRAVQVPGARGRWGGNRYTDYRQGNRSVEQEQVRENARIIWKLKIHSSGIFADFYLNFILSNCSFII